MSVRICSAHKRARNEAKVATYGSSPVVAMPAAAVTMFCSEMPNWKNRSGWRCSKRTSPFECLRSAVHATIG